MEKGIDTLKMCYISDCSYTDIKVTKSANVQELEAFFNYDVTHSNEGGTEDIPLCSSHYMKWYRHTHTPHTNCKTCGRKLRNYSKSLCYSSAF